MATATVSGTLLFPDDSPQVGATVRAYLFPTTTPAYAPSGAQLASVASTSTDASGNWSLTLERTDTMTPTGMVYAIVSFPDTRFGTTLNTSGIVQYITMPAGGGTIEALLTTLPNPPVALPNPQVGNLTASGSITATGDITADRFKANKPWLTLPEGWDDVWRAAKAASGSTPAWVAFIGDSVTQGYKAATDTAANGYAGLVRTSLKNRYGLYGDHFPYVDSVFFQASFLGTPAWTINDTAHAHNSQSGLARGIYWQGDAHPTATLATFVSPYACVDLDIVHIPYSDSTTGQTWKYTVDGGGAVTVTQPAKTYMPTKQTASLHGLASAVHTIVLAGQQADAVTVIGGINCYPAGASGAGIGFVRAGVYGAKGTQFAQNISTPSTQYQVWGGWNGTSWAAVGFPTMPHLAIIGFGINDCGDMNPNAFLYAMTELVRSLRRGRANCAVLFVIEPNPALDTSDLTSGWFTNSNWYHIYKNLIYQIAAEYRCAVYDADTHFGQTPVADALVSSTDPHPNSAGHSRIATALLGVV